MALDPKYAPILMKNPVNYKVFHRVADAHKIAMRDLWASVEGPSKEQVAESVKELSNTGLIAEVPAQLKDFSTYYVTADGLTKAASKHLGTLRIVYCMHLL